MPTVSRRLPQQPHLDVPKREARELLKQWRDGQPEALERVRRRHPKFRADDSAAGSPANSVPFHLADAQLVIAREYGFAHWTQLKERVHSNSAAGALDQAIRADDRETVVRLLTENPKLLHVPVWSGNWGPPMSHAANLGRLDIIKAVADLGARDFQHAFDRALLQGQIECAKWLHEHGAKLAPGIVMGACETLNPAGLRFLSDSNAPFTNERGDRLAPLALVLETYCRNPARKHEVLEIFAQRGYALPETPIMEFHRGRPEKLEEHLRRDPRLVERRFSSREIYPPEHGCAEDGRSGMHGTPIDGTTLLHLAIDFDERAIFDLLLAHGADVNAPATIDAAGFGGHTPLFNAVVSCAYTCGRQRDAAMVRTLLARGASPRIRANLRKFLDWQESPGWHQAGNVTPAEWGRQFPEQSWVNIEALRLLNL
jgi:ankyrin repeat protein